MVSFAAHQIWLAGYDKGSKVTRLEALQQIEKTIGRKPKALENAPEIPRNSRYLWNTFLSLHNSCGGQIGYNDLMAYSQMTGETITPVEVDIIMRMSRESR